MFISAYLCRGERGEMKERDRAGQKERENAVLLFLSINITIAGLIE